MSMSQKAFVFDWANFQSELAPRLAKSLASDDAAPLVEFATAHLALLRDPDAGGSLDADWIERVDVRDVQVVADHVLTKYYDPADDGGVGDTWLKLDDELQGDARAALLGEPFGPPGRLFDPGRMGSYFQSEVAVPRSLRVLAALADPRLADFQSLLQRAVQSGKGLYVTF
jgi:hypothetical protein